MTKYEVNYWEERDRLGIWVTEVSTDETVFEVWDDDARQMFEDGFFKPSQELQASVLKYLVDIRVILDI